MRKFQAALCGLLILCGTMAFAAAGDVASSYVTQENAQANFVALTATGNTATFDVGKALPSNHAWLAVVTGGPATCTISMQGTIDGTTYDTASGPITCTSSAYFYVSGKAYSGVRANLTALTGGTSPTVTVYYVGNHGASGTSGSVTSGQASAVTQGGTPILCDTAASGTVTVGQAQMVRCTNSGVLATAITASVGDGATNANAYVLSDLLGTGANNAGLRIAPNVYNGASWDHSRSADLTNYNTAVTTTAANSIGANLVEKGSRWMVISNPAAGSQATASIASEASVRHVVDCIAFSAASTTAPVLTALTVNVRDGATGAGTIIWTNQVVIPAATGQNVAPFNFCGLNLVGTTATAMTLEFSASLANLIESVSISGFNVN